MLVWTAIGCLIVSISGLLVCLHTQHRRLQLLETWRSEIENGEGEHFVDKASFPATPERGNEDWRDQVL